MESKMTHGFYFRVIFPEIPLLGVGVNILFKLIQNYIELAGVIDGQDKICFITSPCFVDKLDAFSRSVPVNIALKAFCFCSFAAFYFQWKNFTIFLQPNI